RHKDLAADLEQIGDALALQLVGDGLDRAEGLGDVLAGAAVAAGRATGETAAFVGERDREPVELGLRHVADRARYQLLDARAPREQLVARERVVEREHRLAVLPRRERDRGPASRTLRRRIGGDELGVLRFELAQLA